MVFYVGLMSGTSLDGVDAALVSFRNEHCEVVRTAYLPYLDKLKQELIELHEVCDNELERSQTLGCQLSRLYAEAVHALMQGFGETVVAIGCHGQTIRHRPDLGFTLQLNNPSLLAELTGIPVVADFRSRDIAAGGQGAPLVPAFHHAVFGHPVTHRNIVNIGGISNLTNLPPNDEITGFDCGPGNLLMDAWCQRHTGHPYDKNGDWAASGRLIQPLLEKCLDNPFFQLPPPKSTGREAFNLAWLENLLEPEYRPQDVQCTLAELTARGISDAIQRYYPGTTEIYLCGGGAHNQFLHARIHAHLPVAQLAETGTLGIPADWVEAAAFAWLAKQTMEGMPGNLPAVTGAKGSRILGAIYAS